MALFGCSRRSLAVLWASLSDTPEGSLCRGSETDLAGFTSAALPACNPARSSPRPVRTIRNIRTIPVVQRFLRIVRIVRAGNVRRDGP